MKQTVGKWVDWAIMVILAIIIVIAWKELWVW
jgi:hypothetical protein